MRSFFHSLTLFGHFRTVGVPILIRHLSAALFTDKLRVMAKKKNKNYRHSTKFSKFVAVCVVIFAIGYYFYQNSPSFKAKVDSVTQTVTQKLYDSGLISASEEKPVSSPAAAESNSSPNNKAEQPVKKSEAAPKKETKAAPVQKDGLIKLSESLAFPVCPSHTQDHQRRDYKNYSICYRESYEQAEWSAYCLTEEELVKNAGRSDDFRPDPQIKTGSASLADYKGSGYDRGHLSPAADFAFDKDAMSETFYMSNMSPQAGSFNRGIWKDLESEVRNWAKKFGRVYVISGPVLEKPASEYESIGANKVSIPQYYYKVLMAPLYKDEADRATPEDSEKITAIGFILPNKKCTDSFYNYAVSVDEVEKRTGLNFFEGLDDNLENKIEEVFDEHLWK